MENLGCNCSYLQFSISRYNCMLKFPDFKFGTKSRHPVYFRPKKFQGVTLHSIATFAKLHLHYKIALNETISSVLYHFIKKNFGHGIGQGQSWLKFHFMPSAASICFYKQYRIEFGLSSAWNAVQLIYAIVTQIT